MFGKIYARKKTLITGHTGFKGSWLALWLSQMGAKVAGVALPAPSEPNHFDLLDLGVASVMGDIRDADKLRQAVQKQKPDIIFHLAAQAIVRQSYQTPLDTIFTNVMGTVNLLEAVRTCPSVRAVIIVTSDKCYENREWPWGYREIDPLGGYDPYSASKACAEIVTACWRNSFFNLQDYGKSHETLIASARAGNVIGGGDWAADRLIPDLIRAVTRNENVDLRNPQASRPWQHVLEPLSGYLLLGQKLLEGQTSCARAWNFGPTEEENVRVGDLAALMQTCWPKLRYRVSETTDQLHEAGLLRLDCSQARLHLGWHPVWDTRKAVEKTAAWYRAYYERGEVTSAEQIRAYVEDARGKKLTWTQK